MKKNYYLGIFFIILSALGFSTLQMFVKLIPDVSVSNKMFYRNIVITIIMFFVIKYKKISFKINRESIPFLSIRIFFGILGVYINFYTLSYILLADSTTIQKLSSFIMLILSYIFFKEKFTKIQFLSILIAFVGMLFIVKPGSSSFSFGYILAIMGAFSSAFAYLSIRKLALSKSINPLLVVFYFSLISSLVMLVNVFNDFHQINIYNLSILIAIGIFGSIGQLGITLAYNFAPSKEISVFEYIQVVFSSLLGMIFLNEFPDIYSFVGYFIIILTALFMYKYNKKS